MTDRYTKTVLTVIALCLTLLVVDNASSRLPAVRAQSTAPQKRCVWTSIVEDGKPSLGQNGEVKLGREWQSVSDGGWELKTLWFWNGKGAYIFERCEVR